VEVSAPKGHCGAIRRQRRRQSRRKGIARGGGLMLYLDVRLGLIVRVARVRGCVAQYNGTLPTHIGYMNNALK